MSDLIELLRNSNDDIDLAAADEIECLKAENEKLAKAVNHACSTTAIREKNAKIERLEAEIYRKEKRIEAWKQSSDEHEERIELLRENIRMRDDISRCQHKKIERLEAALRRSCQCGEGMCSITGEQCLACAALETAHDPDTQGCYNCGGQWDVNTRICIECGQHVDGEKSHE